MERISAAASPALRVIAGALLFATALLAGGSAQAVTITGLSASPTSYSHSGTAINFTMTFNTDTRAWTSVSITDSFHSFTGLSCSPAFSSATGVAATCNFTYTTTASDTSTLDFAPTVTVGGLDSATYSGIYQITYVDPRVYPTVTLTTNHTTITSGQSVTFTATVTGSAGTPTGTVNFYDDDFNFDVTVPLSGGVATYTTTAITHTEGVEADYSGQAGVYYAGSDYITQTVSGGGVTLTSTASATTQVGQTYSQTNVAAGGVSPYTYSVSGGSVPAGTSLSTATGTVSGTPTTAGAFSYTIQAADSTTPTHLTATQTVSGTIAQGTNVITFPTLADTPFTSTPPALTATASSGLTVGYASNSTGVCTVSGSTISFVSVGICSITASQAGNTNYAAATPVTKTFNVTQGANVITFPTPADTSFSSPPPALTATASSGLTVGYASNSTGVCTVSGSTISFVSVGICSITASQAGNTNYAAATPVTKTFNVTQGSNVITFPTPADTSFSSPPPALTATASSGLTVGYASNSTGVCTVSGSTINFVSVGICSITASQAGNTNYAAATPVTKTFNVTQGANVITFPTPADTSFSSPPPALTATASSGLTVGYASNSTGVCTVSGSTISFVSVGICSITASQAGNTNYAAATPVTKTFNVTQGANVITFPTPADTSFSSPPPALTATASSGLTVGYASNSTGVCTVSGSTITFVSAGLCSITASQAGNTNYAAATPVTKTFNITQGNNVITFPTLADTSFTSTPPALTATASSGLTVGYASNSTGICTVSGSTITFVSTGVCSITASQAGNGNYAAATPVTKTFNVTPGANVITFTKPADTPFTSPPPALTATASSGLTVSYASNSTGICTVAGSTITFVSAGVCSITASQAGNGNYAAATPVTQTFNITAGVNTITFPQPADTPFTSTPPALTATASSGLTVSYASNSTGVCTVAGSTITFVSAGVCSITASQAGNGNYAAATPVTRTFNVTAGVNTITFPQPADTPFTSTPPALTATASSGLTVSYASNATGVCTVAGSAIAFVSAGACSITASQAGNANYVAATPVTKTFNVTPGTNTITFAALTDRTFGSGSFALSATASSGLAVSFASSTSSTCGVSGTTVSLLAVGQCTIQATQGGNASYQAAPSVSRSFNINKATTTVTLTASGTSIFYGVPVTLTATVTGVSPTGTVTFLDGGTSIGTKTLSAGTANLTTKALATGSHTLTASYGGDTSNGSGVSGNVTITVNARPNPALDPNVVGTVNAQVTSMQRFVDTQIDNISGRLQQLHDDDTDEDGSFGLGFNTVDNDQSPAVLAYQQAQPPKDDLGTAKGTLLDKAWAAEPTPRKQRKKTPNHFWISGTLSFGSLDQYGGITNKFTTSGVTAGFDARWFDGFKAGAAIGFGTDETKIGSDGTRTDAQNFNGAIYADYRFLPKTYIDVIAGYGRGMIDSRRYYAAANVFLYGSRPVTQLFGSIALTTEQKWGAWKVAPYLRLDASRMTFDSYTEMGSPIWALNYQDMTANATSGVAGVRTSYDIPMSWGLLTLLGRVEYRTLLQGEYNQQLTYADIGGTVYTITGQPISSDMITGGLGFRAKSGNMDLDFEYDVSAANSLIQASTLRGAIRIGF